MATLTRAITLAAKYHDGQKDKGNQPYLFHPLRMMLNALSEDEQIIAVLHDTVENTDLTLEELREEGFAERIVEAVDALSRRKKESYEDFILRIRRNSLARRVKILDLQDNMAPLRTRKKTDKDKARLKKYSRALDTLLGGSSEPEAAETDAAAEEADAAPTPQPAEQPGADSAAAVPAAEEPGGAETAAEEATPAAQPAPSAAGGAARRKGRKAAATEERPEQAAEPAPAPAGRSRRKAGAAAASPAAAKKKRKAPSGAAPAAPATRRRKKGTDAPPATAADEGKSEKAEEIAPLG